MLATLVEGRDLFGGHDLAVDPEAHEAHASGLGQQLSLLALPVDQQRRQDEQASTLRRGQQLARDLLGRLTPHGLPASMAVLNPHPGVEDAQVVGDLGDGSDGGAGIRAGGLLLDRDGGGEAADGVVPGLLHLAQELPRVGGERLDVAPLALRVERVEGQGGLPGPGHAGQHHELPFWDSDVDGAEIMLPSASDLNVIQLHGEVA
jgi:hypothetical protein